MGDGDPAAKNHSERVGAYVGKMAQHLGFSAEEVWQYLVNMEHDPKC